jgi:DNA polymerase-3 subunit gamma/tau
MLLKGLEEAGRAPNPLAAAEMVLIRIAYTADLPPPDEIIKALGGEAITAPRREKSTPQADAPGARGPLNEQTSMPAMSEVDYGAEDPDEDVDQGLDDPAPEAKAPVEAGSAQLRTFSDVVALVGQRRDAKLKVNLEEHVSLVRFDGVAGAIDLFLLPGAPSEIANELREKLNKWTGRRWVVVLSKTQGEPTIGQVRREREAAELQSLKRHPAVAAVLEAFPDAEIKAVRPLAGGRDDDSATG